MTVMLFSFFRKKHTKGYPAQNLKDITINLFDFLDFIFMKLREFSPPLRINFLESLWVKNNLVTPPT